MAEQSDLGADAITVFGEGADGVNRCLACSLTATWAKLSGDARRIAQLRSDIDEFVFATPRTVTSKTQADWEKRIRTEHGWKLVVVERQEFLAILERPESAWLCNEHLGLPVGQIQSLGSAEVLRDAEETSAAISKALEAERSASDAGDWTTLCRAQTLLAELYLGKHGLGAEYRAKSLEALSTARQHRLTSLLAECLTLRANAIMRDEPSAAGRLLEEARLLVGENGKILRWICLVRAELECFKGDLDEADCALRDWERLVGSAKSIDRQSYYHVRFRLEARRGHHPEALACLNRALRRARARQRRTSVAWMLHEKALYLAGRGALLRAAQEADKARVAFEGNEMEKDALDSALLAGHLFFDGTAAERALGLSDYVLARTCTTGHDGRRQDALQLRTKALQALGRTREARDCNELFRQSCGHNPQALIVADIQDALISAQEGDYERAEASMSSGFRRAQTANAPDEIVAAIKVHWAEIKMEQARYREARSLAQDALEYAEKLPPKVREAATRVARIAEARAPLTSLFENLLDHPSPLRLAGTDHARRIQDAHQALVRPLLAWTDEWPKALQEIYDFWGRGNLARYVLNHRGFRNAFHVVVEATTVVEARQWTRALCPLADVLTILWKGPLGGGFSLVPVRHDYEGAGGWGYAIAAGSDMRPDEKSDDWNWSPAMGWATLLPRDAVEFLFQEARALLEAGRLFLFPAPLVGCIDPGHGPLERMFNDVTNASPILSGHGRNGQSICMGSLPLPFFPDLPLDELARMIAGEEASLLNTRLALREWARDLEDGGGLEPRSTLQECFERVESGLADVERRFADLVGRLGWAKQSSRIQPHVLDAAVLNTEGTSQAGLELVALHRELRMAPWYAFFRVSSLGYRWDLLERSSTRRVEAPQQGQPNRVYHWLVPPKPGWTIPTIFVGQPKEGA